VEVCVNRVQCKGVDVMVTVLKDVTNYVTRDRRMNSKLSSTSSMATLDDDDDCPEHPIRSRSSDSSISGNSHVTGTATRPIHINTTPWDIRALTVPVTVFFVILARPALLLASCDDDYSPKRSNMTPSHIDQQHRTTRLYISMCSDNA
jgi:hypothetical protein